MTNITETAQTELQKTRSGTIGRIGLVFPFISLAALASLALLKPG